MTCSSVSSPALSLEWLNLPLVEINASPLEHDVSEASSNTLDVLEREHDLLLAVDVSVENTENVDELVRLDNSNRTLRMKPHPPS